MAVALEVSLPPVNLPIQENSELRCTTITKHLAVGFFAGLTIGAAVGFALGLIVEVILGVPLTFLSKIQLFALGIFAPIGGIIGTIVGTAIMLRSKSTSIVPVDLLVPASSAPASLDPVEELMPVDQAQ